MRANPATIAGSSPKPRSPCSSMTSSAISREQVERARAGEVARELDALPDGVLRIDSARSLDLAVAPAPWPSAGLSGREQPVNHGRHRRRCRRRADDGRQERADRVERGGSPAAVAAIAGARMNRSSAAISPRSSRRCTTRSMNPCSNRNSLRWKPGGSSWAIVPAATRAPAKPISAFGSARLTSPRTAYEANTPPVVGSLMTLMYGTRAARTRSSTAHVLASCMSASVPSCMRAPPEAETTISGSALGDRVLGGAGDLLADDRAHRAAHEPEVHDADRDRLALDGAGAAHRRVAQPRLRLGRGDALRVRLLVDEAERVDRLQARRRARGTCPGRGASRAAPSADSRKWWPHVGQMRSAFSSCLLNSMSEHCGHFVHRSGG